MRRAALLVFALLLALPLEARAGGAPGRATGWHWRGALDDGVKLPRRGEGWLIPSTWAKRGLSYGTLEAIAFIQRVGKRVRTAISGTTLYVADLSPQGGGPSSWHRSHQNGLDIDLLFFALDAQGRPAPAPASMVRFGRDGWSRGVKAKLQYDTRRNWALVKAIVQDGGVPVRKIFVASHLKKRLLEHARKQKEPQKIIDRAAALLHQPGGAAPHDDHFHVRLGCSTADRRNGCQEDATRGGRKPRKRARR